MQGVDYTTLVAICHELKASWSPARVENIIQRDRYTLCLSLRTVSQRGWMTLSWHPQAARICMGAPPPRTTDTFTFSDQLRHQLNGLALIDIDLLTPWERVIALKFAHRPQGAIQWFLMVEVMNKYSNVILTNSAQQIVTAAHQVSAKQSRIRTIQTGDPYVLPPRRLTRLPKLEESFDSWRQEVALLPTPVRTALTQTYSGLSSRLVTLMLSCAEINPNASTDQLSLEEWKRLYAQWTQWLRTLEHRDFQPSSYEDGYSVFGGHGDRQSSVSALLSQYYDSRLLAQEFQQLRHQLQQIVQGKLKKLGQKAKQFRQQLESLNQAETYREQADLLMAYLTQWQPGMTEITLPEFQTGLAKTIPLNPEWNAVQNAQRLYKRHQKLKRSEDFVVPLLQEVQAEIAYLEQVEDAILVEDKYQGEVSLLTLQDIRDELVQQGYLSLPDYRRPAMKEMSFRTFLTPNGFTVFVGRNNRQNDQLTFRLAGDYDWWFHAQEISGSHVLLRLEPGAVMETEDSHFCAHLAAYYSRARQSEQVPVVYTQPKHVYKPKGAKPGMAIYKHEKILWGRPHQVSSLINALQ